MRQETVTANACLSNYKVINEFTNDRIIIIYNGDK